MTKVTILGLALTAAFSAVSAQSVSTSKNKEKQKVNVDFEPTHQVDHQTEIAKSAMKEEIDARLKSELNDSLKLSLKSPAAAD